MLVKDSVGVPIGAACGRRALPTLWIEQHLSMLTRSDRKGQNCQTS